MKRLLLGVAAALMLSAGQAAADGLPSRGAVRGYDAPEAVGTWNWTGFYVGVGIGGGALNLDVDGVGIDGDGVFGTVVVGYDRQFGPGWVAGVFVDYDFGDISADSLGVNITQNNAWSVGARLGGLITPKTLLYGTAGYTQADFDIAVAGERFSGSEDGYFVGAGFEHMLRENWTLKVEYRYTDFGEEDDISLTSHTGRAVLTYRFPTR